jgi:hypothetical protein
MRISQHAVEPDWCHLCGKRKQNLVDIWYPRNAEHGNNNSEYIRICGRCGEMISDTARGRRNHRYDLLKVREVLESIDPREWFIEMENGNPTGFMHACTGEVESTGSRFAVHIGSHWPGGDASTKYQLAIMEVLRGDEPDICRAFLDLDYDADHGLQTAWHGLHGMAPEKPTFPVPEGYDELYAAVSDTEAFWEHGHSTDKVFAVQRDIDDSDLDLDLIADAFKQASQKLPPAPDSVL